MESTGCGEVKTTVVLQPFTGCTDRRFRRNRAFQSQDILIAIPIDIRQRMGRVILILPAEKTGCAAAFRTNIMPCCADGLQGLFAQRQVGETVPVEVRHGSFIR